MPTTYINSQLHEKWPFYNTYAFNYAIGLTLLKLVDNCDLQCN